MKKIGFIGLGIMGKPMARNLMKKGYSLVVYNRSKGPIEELVNDGAKAALSPKEVAEKSEIIITMLPDSPEVAEVILGENGLLEGARKGAIIIDMSSISPVITKKIYKEVSKKDVKMIDAPVSGGETGAIEGALAIMVGGEKKVFEDCLGIFKVLGKSIVHVGDIGAGGFVKLANQIIVALNMEAMSEALVLGVKAGVDPKLLYEAIKGGLAGSRVLDAKVPSILERRFKAGFKIRLHIKDLKNALNSAKELGIPLPLTSLVHEMFQALNREGKGEEDHSAIIKFIEGLAKVEVKGERESISS
jgi:2-hydroxy-3-oxopropionate reductase